LGGPKPGEREGAQWGDHPGELVIRKRKKRGKKVKSGPEMRETETIIVPMVRLEKGGNFLIKEKKKDG